MRIAVLALMAGSGCAQLFGIEDTSAPADVTIDLQRVSIGSTVVTSPLDLAAPPMFLVGTTATAGTPGAAGEWSASLAGEPSVLYTAPDLPTPLPVELALATRTTRAQFVAFEHPDPVPPPVTSTEMLNVTLPSAYAAGESLEIDALGAWTRHVLAGGELPALGATTSTATIPYTAFVPLTASPAYQISALDQVVVLRYVGQSLTGALLVPPFDQSDTIDVLAGAMIAITPDTPFGAAVDPTTVAGRFAALAPALSPPGLAWNVTAAPGYAVGQTTGIVLVGGAIATTDTSFSSSYANPFAAVPWTAVLTYSASASRTYMLGGNTVTLSASLSSSAGPTPGMVLDLPGGLASATIGGTALATDGMTVVLDPTAPIDVELAPDTSTDTLYRVRLDEITVVGMSVTRSPVIAIEGTEATLTIPAHVLQTGHTYTLVTTCTAGGWTNASAGDLQTFAYPVSVGQVDSAVFTVVAS